MTIPASSRAAITSRRQFDPDVWQPALIGDFSDTEARLAAGAGARYGYRELDEFTNLLQRGFLSVPQVSKVLRSGVLPLPATRLVSGNSGAPSRWRSK